ncbi:MAG: rhodanese-like domain-containing protein [Crocinitomicaceae bacterium]|nr:rhodanese-like domain-containing protein [Crocinitomicaceae bacterium]MCF8444723.1 rhodanese-like domain-containing protein [Crocinitomicaceae bacterium]
MKTLFFLAILTFVAACSSSSNNVYGQVINKKVEKAEFSKLMKKSGVQLIDVRTSREFSNGFITGAKNIDYNGDSFEKQIKKLDKNKPVLVYCAAGGRSENAAELLKEWGFKEVYDLIGGYNGWKE